MSLYLLVKVVHVVGEQFLHQVHHVQELGIVADQSHTSQHQPGQVLNILALLQGDDGSVALQRIISLSKFK